MNTLRYIPVVALGALAFAGACEKKTASAEPLPTRTAERPAPAPDNTAKNRGDGAAEARTPIDQSQSGADVKVTAEIRRSIMDDKAMSVNAQNCKIITDTSGVVTLRGVVASQAEKDSIDAKARAVAGVTRVDNQLEVKPS